MHAIKVAVALTAPINATGMIAAAPCRNRVFELARTPAKGMSVHGTSATGQASEEMAVRVVRIRGLKA